MSPVDSQQDTRSAESGAHGESLEEVRGTVAVPGRGAGVWKNWRAFSGPALLVSVGYMDPGNWSTDLTAGARYKYGLLWVVALSSLMAIVLQICAAKLGVVTGKDLARASRDYFPNWTRWPNWLGTELAIAACDLAEVLGSAVALNLLFHIPLLWGVLITTFDVMLLLALQKLGFRKIEAFILVLVATIAGCYFVELFVLPAVRPDFLELGAALAKPVFPGGTASVALAIAIIGATVMPHNLYLHSAIVQTRKLQRDDWSIRRAIRYNGLDSVIALSLAFLVNAAILVLAAQTFHAHLTGTGKEVFLNTGKELVAITDDTDWIQLAHLTLAPLMGTALASILFAVALLASGQSSTVTGTLAGQIVMEGFMSWKIRPWVRRMITRLIAIVPAVIVIGIYGDGEVTKLLNFSQLVLGLQLPLAMIPLMYFTSRRRFMGQYVNGWAMKGLGWTSVTLITALDVYLMWGLVVG